jgi:hypothetical protein
MGAKTAICRNLPSSCSSQGCEINLAFAGFAGLGFEPELQSQSQVEDCVLPCSPIDRVLGAPCGQNLQHIIPHSFVYNRLLGSISGAWVSPKVPGRA